MELSHGTYLGHYKILASIGTGGMGEVYRAEDTRLDRVVAVKVLPAEAARDTERMRRFVQEAKAASAISHPNVAHIYEVGTSNECNFIAMEYVEGKTLDVRIRDGLNSDQIIDYGIQVAEALEEAHAKGIIHRDIKSANIIITPKDRVKVLDFGLAKVARPLSDRPASELSTAAKTRPGMMFGTIEYMSPEQALGREVDHRSDIFSLGVVLYEMATARLPFAGTTAGELLDSIVHAEPEAITRHNRRISPNLESIVLKCLEKDPAQRYQSASALVLDLQHPEHAGAPGVGRTQPAALLRRSPLRIATLVAVFVAVVATGVYWLTPHEKAIDSIAVLPFTNASSDPSAEYLSDGATEYLINQLSTFPKLRVMARSTVFKYKGKEVDARKLGQDLRVGAVLTGSVRQEGDALTVESELVDAADGSEIWAQKYEGRPPDILSIQQEILNQISKKMGIDAMGQTQNRRGRSVNNEAYLLCLKGRYFWNKRTSEGNEKAVEYFKKAIAKDPAYAAAYSGLADTYIHLSEDNYPKAKEAALKALQLDDSLAEAHVSMAAVHALSWNWSDAEKEFKRGIELNPNYATGRQWYSEYLFTMGRLGEALSQMQRALELDPLSFAINTGYGVQLYCAHRYDEAIHQMKKTLQIYADFDYDWLASAYAQKGMYKESIAEYQKGLSQHPEAAAKLGEIYAAKGYPAAVKWMQEAELAWFQQVAKQAGDEPAELYAYYYASLGDNDHAFEWLQKACDRRSSDLTDGIAIFRFEPHFTSFRTDPRYAGILKCMGLPVNSDFVELIH